MDLVYTGVGIVLLYYGGENLVAGASALARHFGLSRLVIGLTVVAFGTSAPELAASITAAVFRDAPEISLANVNGSNIANIGLILGIAAVIRPMHSTAPFLRREVPLMILISVLLSLLVQQGMLDRAAGWSFVILLFIYLWLLLRAGGDIPIEAEEEEPTGRPVWAALRVTLGIFLLTVGARVLIDGAMGLATVLGISNRVVGLTLVAVGTSLPELATVIVAAMRRESDLILGNLVGSNIFNILCILGITMIIQPLDISWAEVRVDLAVMVAFAISIWPLLYFRMRIGRKRGATLLTAYSIYIATLFF
jgi:cation:H+ antiporter